VIDGPVGDQRKAVHQNRLRGTRTDYGGTRSDYETRYVPHRHQSASVYWMTPRMFLPSSMSL
jgi:hypothetical protein